MITIFGHLEKLQWWRDLSYTVKGSVVRFLKTLLALVVGTLLAAAVGGTLLPAELQQYQFVVVLVVVPLLTSADKFIREWQIEQEVAEELGEPLVDDVSLEDVPEDERADVIEEMPTEREVSGELPTPEEDDLTDLATPDKE